MLGYVISSKKVFDCTLTYDANPLHYFSGGVCMLKIIVKFLKGEKIKRFELEVNDVVIALNLWA